MQPPSRIRCAIISLLHTGKLTVKNTRLLQQIALPIIILFSVSACGAWWLPRAHKIDIQQGNLLSTESVAQVEVGMSKNEVVALLGRPITTNQINPDRWDYIFSFNRSGRKPDNIQRLSVQFENDRVIALDSDGLELDSYVTKGVES